MTSKEDKLFRLIKSMQKAEKIFFKKFASIHRKGGDSNYIKLFDAIDKQTDYDEAKLIRKFRSTNISKYYSASKNYLYENILKSLRVFKQEKTPKSQIHAMTSDAEILIEKGLFDSALKILQKAKKTAYALEYHPELLQIISLEEGLFGRVVAINTEDKITLMKERGAIYKLLNNQFFYNDVYNKINNLARNYRVARSTEDLLQIEEELKKLDQQGISSTDSLLSQTYYYQTYAMYITLTGEYEKEFEYKEKLFKLWKEHPSTQKETSTNYIAIIVGYANACYRQQRPQELYQTLQVLENLSLDAEREDQQGLMFFRLNALWMHYFEIAKDLAEFERILTRIKAELPSFNQKKFITHQRILYINIILICILKEDYQQALEWYWELDGLPKTEVQKDAQYFGQLLSLIVHFKLNNIEILQSICRSVEHKIKQHNKPYAYEHLFLKLFRKLLNTPEYEYSLVYEQYIKSFKALEEDEVEQGAFKAYFDIITWLQAQVNKASMLQVYLG